MVGKGNEGVGAHLPIFMILIIPCCRLLGKRRCKTCEDPCPGHVRRRHLGIGPLSAAVIDNIVAWRTWLCIVNANIGRAGFFSPPSATGLRVSRVDVLVGSWFTNIIAQQNMRRTHEHWVHIRLGECLRKHHLIRDHYTCAKRPYICKGLRKRVASRRQNQYGVALLFMTSLQRPSLSYPSPHFPLALLGSSFLLCESARCLYR